VRLRFSREARRGEKVMQTINWRTGDERIVL